MVDETRARPSVFKADSIAMTHIHRAKGNEAQMVYVVDAHYAAITPSTVARRNTLFTAITRSRAWVRITGSGDRMAAIGDEIEQVQKRGYHLQFKIPSEVERATMRRLHKDRSPSEIARVDRVNKNLTQALADLSEGRIEIEDLAPALRKRLIERLRADEELPFAENPSNEVED